MKFDFEFDKVPPQYEREGAFAERQNMAEQYLRRLDDEDQPHASIIAEELMLRGKPLANTVVIIPVAATQEAANVAHTVSEYARQDTTEPFTVVLGLNAPTLSKDGEQIDQTIAATELAIREHPELDIRSTFVTYDEPIIGRIRRDLWNGVTLASVQTANFLKGEVLGVNHDIDLVELAPTYLGAVKACYDFRDGRHIVAPVSPHRGTLTSHAPSPAHPNISNAVAWNDFYYTELDSAYEAGTIIPLSYYTHHGGFNAGMRTHEVGSLTVLTARHKSRLLAGTEMATSPRRYIARMEMHGYNIWSRDSFSADDDCRAPKHFPDITKDRQLEIVSASITHYAGQLAVNALNRGLQANASADQSWLDRLDEKTDGQELMRHCLTAADKTATKALAILEQRIGSSDLADEFYTIFRNKVLERLDIEVVGSKQPA